ncbi:hypothetical protein AVEN_222995-1 [Araneus ventricosus]|uniref:Uncharacterized protein n=1 Tax=Araneus ventricosus TaxID=182803 RepID=A0A4Y1ZW71_ARAVE|nr:hypothetical protein AVEN_222995-1 [Araneus ventricosus]
MARNANWMSSRPLFASAALGFSDSHLNFRLHMENMQQFTNVEMADREHADLVMRISIAAANAREMLGIFERISWIFFQSMRRRCEACLTMNGKK